MDEQTTDELIAFGGEIKALGEGKIKGIFIRRSTAGDPDLTGDYFSKSSDIRVPAELDVYYNHGLDSTIKTRVIGRGKTSTDADLNIWLETQLNMADEYEKAVYAMAEKGKLGYSSGALPNLVERELSGKGVWMIKTWVVGEASVTPRPAEPRNRWGDGGIVTIKSLITSQAALPDTEAQTKSQEVIKMETDEIKYAVDSAVAAALKAKDDEVKAFTAQEEAKKAAEQSGYEKAVKELEAKGLLAKAPAYIKELGKSDDGAAGFKAWIATGEHNGDLIQPSSNPSWSNTKAAFNVTTGASGSYLVPDPLYNRIIAKRQLMSWVRQVGATFFQTPADHILVPVEATKMNAFTLTAEAVSYNENEPTVNQVDIQLFKYTREVRVSEEFINYQQTNFDQWIADVLARAEGITENTIFTTGSGSGQPQGVYTGATNGNVVTTSAVLVPGDLTTLIGQLGAGYNVKGETGFLMQNATNWYLRGLSSSNYFAFMNTPQPGVETAYNEGFLGKPAYISDDMDAYTVASSSGHSIIYGNWTFYGVAERPGMLIQRNPYLHMDVGQVSLFANIFRGGAVLQGEAFYRTVGK